MKKAEAEAEAREIAREKARAGGEAVQDDTKDAFAVARSGRLSGTVSTLLERGKRVLGIVLDRFPTGTISSDMGPPAKPASAIPKKPAGLKLDTPKPTEPQQATAGMKSCKDFMPAVACWGSVGLGVSSLRPAGFLGIALAGLPDATMNAAAPEGRKFHYDRNFLLQFQAAFKDKINFAFCKDFMPAVACWGSVGLGVSSLRPAGFLGIAQA
jgi:translation initiation factor 4G